MPSYCHLSSDEREQISILKSSGHSLGSIGLLLGRSRSTISRELRRNRLASGRYSPTHAAGAYMLRRQRHSILEQDEALGQFVRDRLSEGWTPEQIAGWLKAGNEKDWRRIATRYDRRADIFMAAITIAAIVIWWIQ